MTPARNAAAHRSAQLTRALADGDGAAVAAVLAPIKTRREMTLLVLVLASCADRRELNERTGWATATPGEFHAEFTRLRARGVARADMDPRVVAGENAWNARSHRQHRAARKGTARAA